MALHFSIFSLPPGAPLAVPLCTCPKGILQGVPVAAGRPEGLQKFDVIFSLCIFRSGSPKNLLRLNLGDNLQRLK